MEQTVLFRVFEERDIDFVYRCKNDEKLNSQIVGQWRPFTYADACKWVQGCMVDHQEYKFWAVCTNDDEKRIVGWVSLSNINYKDQSAHFHGIVIADPMYRDGFAWIESYLFILDYVFNKLAFESLTGSCLIEHKHSTLISQALYFTVYEIEKESICRHGKMYDLEKHVLKKNDYITHYNNSEYDIMSIVMRMSKLRRLSNC
ncbi:MAG: GNAT family N-acetyltransferase [Tidjanibacter sp.]|nr:GNAT family N-acetyltransferase [Tidjanibacter sp.]